MAVFSVPNSRRTIRAAWRRLAISAGVALTLVGSNLLVGGQVAFAATGSALADFVPGGTTGNGRGITFDGTNLEYTLQGDSHIYKVSTSGTPLGSIAIGGAVAKGGPLAWDGAHFWTADYSVTSKLWEVDATTGAILGSCDFVAANPGNPAVTSGGKSIGSFPDGLDFSGGFLWLSGEGALNPGNWVAEMDTSCHIVNSFIAPIHGSDGGAGIAVAPDPFNGDTLWQSANISQRIFQTTTSGAPTGIDFAALHEPEDLAFDSVTFAPKCAVWTNESTFGANHLTAYEVPCPEKGIAAKGTTINAVEGSVFSGPVATFTDPDPNATAAEYTAVIDWGDGSTSAGTVSGPTGGPFTVSGTHTYSDEGTYSILVTITDVDSPKNTATAASTAIVGDAALTAGALTLVGGTEGSAPTSATFSFMDANLGSTAADFTATFSWGDGSSSSGTVTGTAGSYAVSGSHTYQEEGSYTVTVTVVDDGGSTTSGSNPAAVGDAAIAAVCAASAVSGQTFSGPVATVTDGNPNGTASDFTATIMWGDGTSSAGTVSGPTGGPFTVSGTHVYTAPGPYTITTTVVDDGGSTASASCAVLVFAVTMGGNFVIGDQNSAVGTSVTFWGARWAKINGLSGGPAPRSFKGFEDSPNTSPPVCGISWTADPGNSTPPPDGPLPSFMAVIVSSSVTKSGATISGNTVHVVVVKTNPGYDPNPGHRGTGTVVAIVC
jgi:PKD repeat protein